MNKNKPSRSRGIVVALKANFFIVEIDSEDSKDYSSDQLSEKIRLLCTRRSKLDYQGFFIDVGDYVFVEAIKSMTLLVNGFISACISLIRFFNVIILAGFAQTPFQGRIG